MYLKNRYRKRNVINRREDRFQHEDLLVPFICQLGGQKQLLIGARRSTALIQHIASGVGIALEAWARDKMPTTI